MKKRWYFIFAAVLMCICVAYSIAVGGRYVMDVDIQGMSDKADQIQVTVEQDTEILKATDSHREGDHLYVTLESVSPGRVFVIVTHLDDPDSTIDMRLFYVHPTGIITEESFFGRSTGSWCFPIAITLFLGLLIVGLFFHIKKEVRRDLYQYKNVRNIGFALFLTALFIEQLFLLSRINNGIIDSVEMLLHFAGFFSAVALPAAFITFILVTLSNIRLMQKEGRNWRNLLGCILGITVCLGTIFPFALGEFLQQTTIVDVHNQNGMALYIELFVENAILAITSYLELILIGTIILSTKAARGIPAFDKDYIIIHGCQIKKDGTLTNLLKGRADRAIEFAKMQKDKTGKDMIFIPSGGKGNDEVISEADAIKNYLLENGIQEDRILAEDKSVNTFENLKNAKELIRKDAKTDDPKIAFSTTNYHVFRTGVFASQQGIKAEGIGAKTKRYFWINAFIREFIAALVSEWKTHLAFILTWLVLIVSMVGIVYISNNF